MEETLTPLDSHLLTNVIIEPHLGSDTLMSIDHAKLTESVLTILTFLAILLMSLYSGFFGPKTSSLEIAVEPFEEYTDAIPTKFNYSVVNLSALTKYLNIQLVMESLPGVTPAKANVSVIAEIIRNSTVKRLPEVSFDPLPVSFLGDNKTSKPFFVFKDNSIDYDLLSIQFSFQGVVAEYNATRILFESGNVEFTLYEVIFRLLFSVSNFCFLLLFLFRLRSTRAKFWHTEQKITVALLFFVSLYNNPLYALKYVSWSKIFAIEAFLKGIMVGYGFYFLFVLFDYLRYTSRSLGTLFFVPKILISSILAFLIDIYGLLNVYLNIFLAPSSARLQMVFFNCRKAYFSFCDFGGGIFVFDHYSLFQGC